MEIHPHPRLLHDLKNTDQACINLEEFAQLNCDGTQRFPVGSSMEIEIAPTAEIGLGQWTDWRAGRHIVVLGFCISIGQRLQHRELRQLLDQYRELILAIDIHPVYRIIDRQLFLRKDGFVEILCPYFRLSPGSQVNDVPSKQLPS